MTSISNIAKNVGSSLKNISKSSVGSYKSVRDNSRSGSSLLGSVLSSVGSSTRNSSGVKTQTSGKSILGSIADSIGSIKGNTNNRKNYSSLISKYTNNRVTGLTGPKTGAKTSTILTSLFSPLSGNTKSKTNVSNAISNLLSSAKARTGGSSFFSNLLGRRNSDTGTTAGSSKATTISPLNVFGGLKNLISGAKGNINQGDGTTRVNTIGLLGLSTTLGSASQRIQDSFANWKSKLGLLPMSGNATDSANKATNQMTSLFSRFSDFSNSLSNRILGRADSAKSADIAGVLGASDDLSGGSGLFGKVGNLLGGSKSSSSSTTGSSSMNNSLNSKSDVERWAALHGVSNTRTWGCLLFASARTGIPCMYGHAKYAVADGGLMYKLMGYEVGTTPRPGALCLHGTHAQCVEGVNSDGSINTSEANHHHDFAAQQHFNPPAGTIYVYPKTGLAGLI